MNTPIIQINKLYKKYKDADDFSVNDLNLVVAHRDGAQKALETVLRRRFEIFY